jgi:cytoskeletal protein RodZ
MTFLHKRVREGDASFGSDLRDLRELRGIAFDEACKTTKIDARILKAFEEDRLEELDDPIFVGRHLAAYVKYLGGYEPYFRMRYESRLAACASARKTEDLLPRMRKIGFFDLFAAPQFLAFLGILAFGLLLGGYVLWQAHAVGMSPPLTVDRPRDGEVLDTPRADIRGTTIAEATVTVNGRDAPVSSNGAFNIQLDVSRGTTAITIISRRRRGSETRIVRHVTYERELPELDVLGDMTGTSTAAGSGSGTSTNINATTSR